MKLTVVLLTICSCYATIVNSASKYYDGPIRPYEFGYSIEGNQHRHEKKDENGIIMGEFGFITADGVYHVTVYATDENGNFRIISMKNIKIGLPGENLSSQPKSPVATTTAVPLRTTRTPTYASRSPPSRKNKTKKLKPSDAVSCSSCFLPRSQGGQSDESDESNEDNLYPGQNQDGPGGDVKIGVSNEPGTGGAEIPPRPNTLFTPLTKKTGGSLGGISKASQNPQLAGDSRPSDRPQGGTNQQGQITGSFANGKNLPRTGTSGVSRSQGQTPDISTSGQSPEQRRRVEGKFGESPPSRFEGEAPRGKSVDEGGLLYKFNYTVGYHGHHEIGDYEGVKDGGYHFVGRDGLRRKIDYLANEFGYQPYLKLEKADDKDVPKEETEKEAGLKGYEFKWFNRPANAKKRRSIQSK